MNHYMNLCPLVTVQLVWANFTAETCLTFFFNFIRKTRKTQNVVLKSTLLAVFNWLVMQYNFAILVLQIKFFIWSSLADMSLKCD